MGEAYFGVCGIGASMRVAHMGPHELNQSTLNFGFAYVFLSVAVLLLPMCMCLYDLLVTVFADSQRRSESN